MTTMKGRRGEAAGTGGRFSASSPAAIQGRPPTLGVMEPASPGAGGRGVPRARLEGQPQADTLACQPRPPSLPSEAPLIAVI